MVGRRCICGRSQRLPLCDGSHQSAGWSCEGLPAAAHARVFAAAPHNQTVVERLAHARRGQALHRLEGSVIAEQLVIITDGADLDTLGPALRRVDAHQTRVLVLGADPALVGAAFPGAQLSSVADAPHPAVLWSRIMETLDRPGQAIAAQRPGLFLSHASADEARLMPAVAALRAVGIDVFVCGDSIPGGSRWWDEIRGALQACDRFVLVLSDAARSSVWCAFEAGAAMAWDKPVQLISLDGAPPPSYVAHLQAHDLPRSRRLRPWLDDEDALMEALLAPLLPPLG